MARKVTEAKEVHLLRTKPRPDKGDETTFEQHWRIKDHTGKSHMFKTTAGWGDEPRGRGLNKKFHVGGNPATAGDLLGHAISTGEGPTMDGDKYKVGKGDSEYEFAWKK